MMRGYKAKVLRRIAQALHPDDGVTRYGYGDKGPTHVKWYFDIAGVPRYYKVTNPIHVVNKARKLYRSMKKEMTHGITR